MNSNKIIIINIIIYIKIKLKLKYYQIAQNVMYPVCNPMKNKIYFEVILILIQIYIINRNIITYVFREGELGQVQVRSSFCRAGAVDWNSGTNK